VDLPHAVTPWGAWGRTRALLPAVHACRAEHQFSTVAEMAKIVAQKYFRGLLLNSCSAGFGASWRIYIRDHKGSRWVRRRKLRPTHQEHCSRCTNPNERSPLMTERSDYVQISARIPAELASGLEESAAREDRTMSAELRRAIRQYLTVPAVEAGVA
jgi:hypothetical protein